MSDLLTQATTTSFKLLNFSQQLIVPLNLLIVL
jgi:hypothetical protein